MDFYWAFDRHMVLEQVLPGAGVEDQKRKSRSGRAGVEEQEWKSRSEEQEREIYLVRWTKNIPTSSTLILLSGLPAGAPKRARMVGEKAASYAGRSGGGSGSGSK